LLSIPCYELRKISANHLFVIKIDFKKLGITRSIFCKKMFKKNIGTQLHYIPIPLHKTYKNMGYNLKKLPNTREYFKKAISIPIFVNLKYKTQMLIVSEIKKILRKN